MPSPDGSTVEIRPMGVDLVTNVCLHHGPLAACVLTPAEDEAVDARLLAHPWPDSLIDELAPQLGQNLFCPPGRSAERREFLREVTLRYGACAIQAWDGDLIVGVVRFFPSSLLLRLGQRSADLQTSWFWPAVEADDPANTLFVLCVETGAATFQPGLLVAPPAESTTVDPVAYQRRGIGSQLVTALIEWARAHGWARLQVGAGQDLEIVYGLVGTGGRTFWEKLGFQATRELPPLPWNTGDLPVLSYQASRRRMDLDDAQRQWLMVLDLE